MRWMLSSESTSNRRRSRRNNNGRRMKTRRNRCWSPLSILTISIALLLVTNKLARSEKSSSHGKFGDECLGRIATADANCDNVLVWDEFVILVGDVSGGTVELQDQSSVPLLASLVNTFKSRQSGGIGNEFILAGVHEARSAGNATEPVELHHFCEEIYHDLYDIFQIDVDVETCRGAILSSDTNADFRLSRRSEFPLLVAKLSGGRFGSHRSFPSLPYRLRDVFERFAHDEYIAIKQGIDDGLWAQDFCLRVIFEIEVASTLSEAFPTTNVAFGRTSDRRNSVRSKPSVAPADPHSADRDSLVELSAASASHGAKHGDRGSIDGRILQAALSSTTRSTSEEFFQHCRDALTAADANGNEKIEPQEYVEVIDLMTDGAYNLTNANFLDLNHALRTRYYQLRQPELIIAGSGRDANPTEEQKAHLRRVCGALRREVANFLNVTPNLPAGFAPPSPAPSSQVDISAKPTTRPTMMQILAPNAPSFTGPPSSTVVPSQSPTMSSQSPTSLSSMSIAPTTTPTTEVSSTGKPSTTPPTETSRPSVPINFLTTAVPSKLPSRLPDALPIVTLRPTFNIPTVSPTSQIPVFMPTEDPSMKLPTKPPTVAPSSTHQPTVTLTATSTPTTSFVPTSTQSVPTAGPTLPPMAIPTSAPTQPQFGFPTVPAFPTSQGLPPTDTPTITGAPTLPQSATPTGTAAPSGWQSSIPTSPTVTSASPTRSSSPSRSQFSFPTAVTIAPTSALTNSSAPTALQSDSPTAASVSPTASATNTEAPTAFQSASPTTSTAPTSARPTETPTSFPVNTALPTTMTVMPTVSPTTATPTTSEPTLAPVAGASVFPSFELSDIPSSSPTLLPEAPTQVPSSPGSPAPTTVPTVDESDQPSTKPSWKPTPLPTQEGTSTMHEYSGLSTTFLNVDELSFDQLANWETTTSAWFEAFYMTDVRERRGLKMAGVRDLKTMVKVTDQQVTEQGGTPINTIFYNQRIAYVALSIAPDPETLITAPYKDSSSNELYAESLKASDPAGFSNLMTPIAPPNPPQEGGAEPLSVGVVVAIVVGAGVAVFALGYAGYKVYTRKRRLQHMEENQQQMSRDSNRTKPNSFRSSPLRPSNHGLSGDEGEYSLSYMTPLGLEDADVVSTAGTLGTKGVQGESILTAGSSGTPPGPVKRETIHVLAPSGSLGCTIDTPDSGPPVVQSIKPRSVIAHRIKVGDKVVAVDDEDVRHLTAIRVSRIIANKSSNPVRKLTIVRTTRLDEREAEEQDIDTSTPIA